MTPYYEYGLNNFKIFTTVNMTFPHHLHTHIEIIYVLDGTIEVGIGSQNRTLHKGDFSIAFPNRIHSYNTQSNWESNVLLGVFPVEMSGDFMNTLLKKYPTNPYIIASELHPDIAYALNSCLIETEQTKNLGVITAFFQLILARTLPYMELRSNKDTNQPTIMARLVTYLSENFTEPISLDTLSNHFGISKYSISRIFSDKMHTSLTTYLNTLRINYAKMLLQQSDSNILTISILSGYENSRTFNREFLKLCGCTPREYRKKGLTLSH